MARTNIVTKMDKEEQLKQADQKIGKYIQWENGYRLFVIGRDPKYPEDGYLIRDPVSGKEWGSSIINIAEATEITEEIALQQFSLVEINKPQTPFCSCGNWRVGQPNVSLVFDLQQGQISINEAQRIEGQINTFFLMHGISSRIHRSNKGIKLEFISLMGKDKNQEKHDCCSKNG